jgi:hypothetical protein
MTKLIAWTATPVLTLGLVAACAGSPPPPPAAASASGTAAAPAAAAGPVDTSPLSDPVANVPPTCAHGTKAAATGLIDDFEDGNDKPATDGGRNGSWWIGKADHATITLPKGPAKPSPGGPDKSKHAMHFVGKTDNSDTWGAAVGVNFLPSGFYDASKYAGIAFKIKSAKPNLDVRLKVLDVNTHPEGGVCKDCFNAFGRELILGTEWKDVSLMWSELTQQSDWGNPRPPMIEPSKLHDMEWQIWPGNEFDIWIDDVHFLECQ